jgi:hypothetical protein
MSRHPAIAALSPAARRAFDVVSDALRATGANAVTNFACRLSLRSRAVCAERYLSHEAIASYGHVRNRQRSAPRQDILGERCAVLSC